MSLIWLALRGNPRQALAGLAARLRRYRVRGRGLLAEAAAQHPDYYAWWARSHGPKAIARWCDEHPVRPGHAAGIALLLLGEDPHGHAESRIDLACPVLRVPPVQTAATLMAALDRARQDGAEWLVALRAGDRVEPGLAPALSGASLAPEDTVVFWDHDFHRPDGSVQPVVKPNWDPVLAQRHDVLTRASAVRIDALQQLLAAGPGEGAALWEDLVGEALDHFVRRRDPYHVPLILTHLADPPPPVRSTPKITPSLTGDWPGVSFLVPTRDSAELLGECIACIDRLSYPGPIEVIVIDNDSVEERTFSLFETLRMRGNCQVLRWPGPFNFAAMMNGAADHASQPFLCLLNNDVLSLDDAWLTHMMAHARQADCGAVGARLLYPEGVVQHAGVAIGIGGAAGHVAKGAAPDDDCFALWHGATRRVSAVTAACLVVEKAKFHSVGGMDEVFFAIDFNDVDLCLKLDRAGWRNVVVMESTLVHLESMSRGTVRQGADRARFDAELAELKRRWRTEGHDDPWFSPLFSRESERCVLRT